MRTLGPYSTPPQRDPTTNIIDQREKSTFCLPDEKVQVLMEHLEACRLEKAITHFSERQETQDKLFTGVMVDFDLYLPRDRANAELLDRHCHRLAGCMVSVLAAELVPGGASDRPGGRPREFKALVFFIVKERPVAISEAGKGEQYKYGFHVLVPGVRVGRGYKKHYVKRLRTEAKVLNVMTDLGVLGSPADCVDAGSATVPVLFLGSCKVGGSPYHLSGVYEVACEPDEYPMIQKLPEDRLRGYNLVYEMALGFEARYSDNRPPLVAARDYEPRPDLAAQVRDEAARAQGGLLSPDEVLLAEHSLSTLTLHDPEALYLHQLLDLLDESYAREYPKWRNVVYALANTSEAYRPLAEWFSQKYARWAAGVSKRVESFDRLWEEAVARRGRVERPVTKRSIIHWARESDPQRFREIVERGYFTILTRFVYEYGGNLEHYMVAKVLHAMIGSKFVTDVVEHGARAAYHWYEFVVPGQDMCPGEVWKWRRESEPDEIQKYISENFVRLLDDISNHIDEERQRAAEDEHARYWSNLGKRFASSRGKVFNNGFKRGVVEQGHYVFRARGFAESLDQDGELMGVGNGVLRIGAEPHLIDYFHEFPVSKSTRVPYRPFDPESPNPWERLILDALVDIIPEPDARVKILFFLSTGLSRSLKEAIMLFLAGGGENGKTFLLLLLRKVLGKPYAAKLNIQLLASDRESADRPNSAVMRLKGRGYGFFEESNKHERLNTARLKEVVNPSEISASDKHEKQEEFKIATTLVAASQYPLLIETKDHGTWRRLWHYTCKTKFCRQPDPNNPYEKQDDPRFSRQYVEDPDCLQAFLGIMVYFYMRLQREYGGNVKNVPSPTIDRETQVFRNSQDSLNRFITERIVVSPGCTETYTMAVLGSIYGEWYNTHIDNRKHVASEVIDEFENSAIRKYCRRLPNRSLALHGCRVLPKEQVGILQESEFFIGCDTEEEDIRVNIERWKSTNRDRWWMPGGTPGLGEAPAQQPLRPPPPGGADLADPFGLDDFVDLGKKPTERKEVLPSDPGLDGYVDSVIGVPPPIPTYDIEDVFGAGAEADLTAGG